MQIIVEGVDSTRVFSDSIGRNLLEFPLISAIEEECCVLLLFFRVDDHLVRARVVC